MIVEIAKEKQNPKAVGAAYSFSRWEINNVEDLELLKKREINWIRADVLEYLALNRKYEEAFDTSAIMSNFINNLTYKQKQKPLQFSTGDYHITITTIGGE